MYIMHITKQMLSSFNMINKT